MSRPIRGQALILGDHVNTDELHPSRFYSLKDETVREGFLGAVAQAQRPTGACPIVVAGHNFGCGSSRETGARVFLLAGVEVILAESFARIFHRNVLNLGLPARVCPGVSARARAGEELTVDLEAGEVHVGGESLALEPLDPFYAEVLAAGGLARWVGLP